jgi:DNA-binding CsgD family transcriptional regulator
MVDAANREGMYAGSTQLGRPLSWRERRVLVLIAEGWTNVEIAAFLNVAESTIAADVRSLRAKLGAKNRAHAVALWWRGAGHRARFNPRWARSGSLLTVP